MYQRAIILPFTHPDTVHRVNVPGTCMPTYADLSYTHSTIFMPIAPISARSEENYSAFT